MAGKNKQRFNEYRKRVERQWDLQRFKEDLKRSGKRWPPRQDDILTLVLCDLNAQEISEVLGRTDNDVRVCIHQNLSPKVTELLGLNPESSVKIYEFSKVLAKHGYNLLSWEWMLAQAQPANNVIYPKTASDSQNGGGNSRRPGNFGKHDPDIGEDVFYGQPIPEVVEKEQVEIQIKLGLSHDPHVILISRDDKHCFCLAPSKFAPHFRFGMHIPQDGCPPLAFFGKGREHLLAIVSDEPIELPWSLEGVEHGLIELYENHLEELADLIDQRSDISLLHACFIVK